MKHIRYILLAALFVPILVKAQIKTIYFNEPYRLALTFDQEWYFQNLNDMEGKYLYGDYRQQNDSIILMSSVGNEQVMLLKEHARIVRINNPGLLATTNYDLPALLYYQSEFYSNGALKSLLLDVNRTNNDLSKYQYQLALFNIHGEFIRIEEHKMK